MSCWRVDVTLPACPALAALVTAVHGGFAALPWLAGCDAWLAAALSVASLATLPGTLRSVPGWRCPVVALRFSDGDWTVTTAGGGWQAASVCASSRVFPGAALCRLRVAGQMLDLWVPRHALAAADFRRLKVALRAGHEAGGG
jgi:hypothetical protein